jgi:K(+)-stimulated pyrophosphate-energized sodium pump
MGVCVLGLLFGLVMYKQLENLPVHRSMREISELIYETCKTYLQTQGKFIIRLALFIGAIILVYFGWLRHFDAVRGRHHPADQPDRHRRQLRRRLVRHPHQHLRQLALGVRQPARQAVPTYDIPLKAGMSIGMLLISVELVIMLAILLFVPGDYAGPCFIGFAIGESLGAAALRIAGGIFTKIADIGSDLMKIVFNIKETTRATPA